MLAEIEGPSTTGDLWAALDFRWRLCEADPEPVAVSVFLGTRGTAELLRAVGDGVLRPGATFVLPRAALCARWRGHDPKRDMLRACFHVAGRVIGVDLRASDESCARREDAITRCYQGFPVGEVAAWAITKHSCTGGLVSAGALTTQLRYETALAAHRDPGVTSCLTRAQLAQKNKDRVRIARTSGIYVRKDLVFALSYLAVELQRYLLVEARDPAMHLYKRPDFRALRLARARLLGAGLGSLIRPHPRAEGRGEYLGFCHREAPIPTAPPGRITWIT